MVPKGNLSCFRNSSLQSDAAPDVRPGNRPAKRTYQTQAANVRDVSQALCYRLPVKDLFALKLFTRVARLGSFSAAARELGLSQSQASRIISELETTLGARLLSRTTRAVVPNDAGAEYLARIEPILDALDEADQSLRGGGALRGMLRVGMPTSVALRDVIPRLGTFTQMHPDLHVHIIMEDKRQDLVREAVDVAIRVGRLPDASATARLIARTPRTIIAAPGYLESAGIPKVPADLAKHRIVGGPATAAPSAWTFERTGESLSIDLEPHVSFSDNEGAIAGVASGLGITSTTRWACRREIEDGSLVCLLPDWTTPVISAYAYFPMGRGTRAAARAFIEFLIAEFQAGPTHRHVGTSLPD